MREDDVALPQRHARESFDWNVVRVACGLVGAPVYRPEYVTPMPDVDARGDAAGEQGGEFDAADIALRFRVDVGHQNFPACGLSNHRELSGAG